MSEMMASNERRFSFSIASSVDFARTKLTPNASSAWRSCTLLFGLSSTQRTVDLPALRITRGVTISATTSTAARASLAVASGAASGPAWEAAAAARAAAASALRFAEASKPPPFSENSPMLAIKSRNAAPKRISTKSATAGHSITPSNFVIASISFTALSMFISWLSTRKRPTFAAKYTRAGFGPVVTLPVHGKSSRTPCQTRSDFGRRSTSALR